MPASDIDVEATTEEPHGTTTATTMNNATPTTTTTTNPSQAPTSTHTNTEKPQYTIQLPALSPKHIRFTYCNVNGLKTDCPAELENLLTSFLPQSPTILGLIETQQNWKNYEKTVAPIC